MFGGSYSQSQDWCFESIPLFVQKLIQICCNDKAIERAGINSVIEKLDKYQELDIQKLFERDFIEVSPYFIDESDLGKILTLGETFLHFVQKSTKKNLTAVDEQNDTEGDGTDRMKAFIQISQCRNCIPIYGFTYIWNSYQYLCEYDGIWEFSFGLSGLRKYETEKKIGIVRNMCQFYADMFELGYISHPSFIINDNENQAKFSPSLPKNYYKSFSKIKEVIKDLAKLMYDLFNDTSFLKSFSTETPLFIQALIRRMVTGKAGERPTLSQIANVFDNIYKPLKNEIKSDEYLTYTSNKNPELIEEATKVEILMERSNLVAYSRDQNQFRLGFQSKSESIFLEYLHDLENLSIKLFKGKLKLKSYTMEREYNGSHCLVQYYAKGDKKIVLKTYHKNYGKVEKNYGIFSNSDKWEDDEQLIVKQDYQDVYTLEECLEPKCDFINKKLIGKLIQKILSCHSYFRFSPHNICIGKNDHKVKIVDTLIIDSNNYEDLKTEFMAPECQNFPELNENDKKSAVVYTAGLLACALFGLKLEIDSNSKHLKLPIFPDDFPKFWKDFIILTTRENSIDRPSRKYLMSKIQSHSPFDEADFIQVSSKLLNHVDYVIEDPINAGGEAVIYQVTNAITKEKHACKKLKFKIRSIKTKKMLQAIEKLGDSIFGIKYLGISMNEENVYLHMEYVPNGSLGEIITLDRRMKSQPWFTDTARLRLAKEIANGMKYLHDHEIVHKDLKPENVLLDMDNSAKICDFSFIPEEGAMTPMFMAPELFNGEEATFKSDVYAYAVTVTTLFGGGDMIGSAANGFRPSISVNTPLTIQDIIKKCWQQNPDERLTFAEIVDELNNFNNEDFDLRIESMSEFPNFDPNVPIGVLNENYEYEICEITGDADDVEHFIRLHITIQPENILHVHKYCRLGNKIVLILERIKRKTTLDSFLIERKKVSQQKGEKFISDFISLFELYHKNKFYFGPFSLKRLFFRDQHRSSICFDLFEINGLKRPQNYDDVLIKPPEDCYYRESDIFAFACFVLKIFDCLSLDDDGHVSRKPFKRSSRKEKQPIPFKYQNIIMERCLSKEPMTRPTFELLFQKLFPVQYKIISTFLSVSVSRFSTFSMKSDFRQEEIEFMETLGSGTFGKVVHAYNTKSNQDLAVKEFNDATGEKNNDFMLEYVALKAIDHPNIVKIIGSTQRKELIHGSRLFMEFASNGDLEKNMNEPFEWFIIHLFQVSSAMKYLHQRGIIHFDLKPKNILIREDGSAVVADFNTAMHVEINTYLRNRRGSENYMSPEIRNAEKYSFSSDVFSFGMMAAEYFSPDAHQLIREANAKHEHPSLYFITDANMRSLIEFCVDDDPMSRPSFDLICNTMFNKFIKDTARSTELEGLLHIPRIDEDKLNQIRILASRGCNEAIVEYGRYLLLENSFDDAMNVFHKGAINDDASCLNTVGVLSETRITSYSVKDPFAFIELSAEGGDKYGMTNYGIKMYKDSCVEKAIDALEQAYAKGVTFAGYLLGLVFSMNRVKGITTKEKIKKIVDLFHDAAKEGDAFAQYKYGICLEEGLATDEEGYDCVHYFRQAAYQRHKEGCEKYSEYLTGERQKYYQSFEKVIPYGDYYYLMEDVQVLFDEMMSCHTGMLLYDENSKEKYKFLKKQIKKLYSS